MGNVSASSVQEKRIFISNDSLPGWKSPTLSCQMFAYPPQKSILDYDGTDPNITFYAFDTINIPPNQILIETKCMDCTYQGGTTTETSFLAINNDDENLCWSTVILYFIAAIF